MREARKNASPSYFEMYAPQSVALKIIMTAFFVNATKNRSHYIFFIDAINLETYRHIYDALIIFAFFDKVLLPARLINYFLGIAR